MKHLAFLKVWVPLAVAITALCLLIYAAVQQDIRIGGYDPQVQMAEDTAFDLSQGKTPVQVLPQTPVEVTGSLSPFMIIYDSSGKVLASSVTLDNQTPKVPQGIFSDAQNKELRFTWQPRTDVRIATIVTKYNGGFVLAGRSMREIENRTAMLLFRVGAVWVGTLFATLIVTIMGFALLPKKH